MNACKEDGIHEPEYIVNPGDIMIKFSAPEDRIIRRGKEGFANEEVNEEVNEELNRTDRVYTAIRQNQKMKRHQLAEYLGLSKGTLDREIALLTTQKRIRRVGSDKTGHWEVIE